MLTKPGGQTEQVKQNSTLTIDVSMQKLQILFPYTDAATSSHSRMIFASVQLIRHVLEEPQMWIVADQV